MLRGVFPGQWKDASGAVVAGAKVTATNVQTGLKRTIVTGDQGFYALLGLPLANYEIEVRSSGFEDYRQTNLANEVNISRRVDITLQVGKGKSRGRRSGSR